MSRSDTNVEKQEEIIKTLNAILAEVKEGNLLTKEHDKTVESISARIRKIGFNLNGLR